MPKITLSAFVHLEPSHGTGGTPRYLVMGCNDMSEYGYVLVGPHEFEFDVPADFDPTAGRVSALQKKREKLTDEFQKSVAQINEQISRLQCLEFTPSAHEAFSSDGSAFA